jgi:hypothetical protein
VHACFSRFDFRRHTRRLAALSLALTLAAPQAHAIDLLDPTGPLRVALLVRIATITARIHAVCDSIARATRSIQERQELMFPREALDKIGSVFQTVRSLGDELRDLAPQYTLSVDAGQIRLALEGEAAIVRANLSSLWGAPSGPERDLDEYLAWAGHRRTLSATSYLAVHDQWQDAASSLAHQARAGGSDASALRSIRLTAVAASMGLQQAAAANQLAAERLDAAQEALDLARHDALLADALGDVLLAGFDPQRQQQQTTIPGIPDDVVLGGWL